MALAVFNTLSRQLENFVPLDPHGKKVGLYCCGPTIHDFAHIGNFRTFVFADLMRRYLAYSGYEVKHVMNITDVEDKIIRRVREAGTSLKDYTAKYEAAFLEDLKTLACLPATDMPRATEHIPEIIELVEKLIERGIAYKAVDGSVYFSIEKYRGCGCTYGQLVKLNFEEMRQGERVSSDEYEKESIADFALWKARVPEDGQVFWDSPWGQGRPGWHIECSAMSMKSLGNSFDLHLGGEDLMFPHHEDEIAQSEGAGVQEAGKRFVKYWMHGAHLLVEGKKMAKSLGNFFTLRDLLAKGYAGREIRYLFISAHYREQFNFTLEGLESARAAIRRLDECLGKLREIAGSTPVQPADPALLEKIRAELDHDLNVSGAWGEVFIFVSQTNKSLAAGEINEVRASALLSFWAEADKVFGLGTGTLPSEVPAEFQDLLDQRQAARKAKDFKRSDQIRDELKAKGWVIEDTPKGPKLKKV